MSFGIIKENKNDEINGENDLVIKHKKERYFANNEENINNNDEYNEDDFDYPNGEKKKKKKSKENLGEFFWNYQIKDKKKKSIFLFYFN